MPGINDVKENKYLSKEDCEPPSRGTITGWKHENLALQGQPEKMKYVIYFKECKPLALNNTNAQRIALIAGSGDDFNKWVGYQVTLFNDKTVEFGGNFVGGVRVHVPQNEPVVGQQPNQGVSGQVYPAAGQNMGGNPEHKQTIDNAMANKGIQYGTAPENSHEATGDGPPPTF